MPAPTKRSRTTDADDEPLDRDQHARDVASSSSAGVGATASSSLAATATPPRRNVARRSPVRRTPAHPAPLTAGSSSSTASTTPTRAAPGTSTPTAPSRIATRTPRARLSLASASLSPSPAATTRSASLSSSASVFGLGRGANSPVPPPSLMLTGSPGPSRASGSLSVLTRAASMSAVPTLGSIKEVLAGSGGSAPPPAKGGSDPDGNAGPSGGRWGKGKENIPPKPDSPAESSSRKRVRVSARASSRAPSRTRSASVVSVRSESVASSVPPSSFTDLSSARTSSCLPSPSPSPSIATTVSFDTTVSSLTDDSSPMDVDGTPTKRGKRPAAAMITGTSLITPPPSSPVPSLVDAIDGVNVRSRTNTRSPSRDTLVRSNPYRVLKSALRLSSSPAGVGAAISPVDAAIVGRDDEKAVLQSYLSLVSTCDVGMYVSGPPGTGKTALTTAVGRGLAMDGWRIAEIGVMGLRATDVWARLGDELGCGRSEEDVVAHLSTSGSRTFIILDEVDSLLPPAPSLPPPATSHVLSKLFSLPLISASGTATVKLVAISNTLDLTVRANLVLADGAMPQVLPFRAYNAIDMTAIVAARIAAAGDGPDTAKVDPRAAELLCRKVEAQNGDLRMCLGVLAAAVNLAEADWVKKTGDDKPLVKVALPHVLKAFTSHTQQLRAAAGSSACGATSATGSKIRSVPLQGRMVLVALLIFLMRSRAGLAGCPAQGANSESLTVSALYATYAHVLSYESAPFPPSPEGDYRDLLSNLETLGLVKLTPLAGTGRAPRAAALGLGPRVELCVREEEVKDGLGLAGATPVDKMGRAEEEVLRVWSREDDRVGRVRARAVAALERAESGLNDDFA
ncbi:AAA ATPase [Apiotrichum porosum]|uniref:AAA ATPase n=1 Tax=Apiotrichum porosum TaxID=105984 RepID=A0A427XLW9_9TREE|nr:AAA ATPase [Apiotrichum porosum]RSH79813.1 AAA ATPase [Apiotrichum porosum]